MRIDKDGVLHEFHIGIKGILCKMDFHRWIYHAMSIEFIAAFDHSHVFRTCERCDYMETTSNGKDWHARI